jgi:PAS domain S-box-containing protein
MNSLYQNIFELTQQSPEAFHFLMHHASQGVMLYHETFHADSKVFSALGYNADSFEDDFSKYIHSEDEHELKDFLADKKRVKSNISVRLLASNNKFQQAKFETLKVGDALLLALTDLNSSTNKEIVLRKLNQRLEHILSNTGDLIFVMSPDLVYLDCYGTETNMLMKPSDFIGKKLTDFPYEEPAYSIVLDSLEICKKTKERVYDEYYLHFGENKMWFAMSCKLTVNPDTKEEEIIAVIKNITAIKEKEENLRQLLKEKSESDARWQFALEGAGDGIWDYNIFTNEIYLSAKWKEMLGYKEHEMQNSLTEWYSRIHPEDIDRCLKELNDYMFGKTDIYRNEHRMQRKDGKYIWVLDRGKIIERTEDGLPKRFIGTKTDITKRKEIELEILQKNETIDSLIANLPGIVYRSLFDKDWTTLYVNKDIERMTGYPYEGFLNKSLTYASIIHQADRDWLYDKINKSIKSKEKFEFEYRLIAKNGRIIWVKEKGGGVYDRSGNLKYIDGLIFDITDRKELENSLSQTKEILEQVSEIAQVGGWEINLDTNKVFWSDIVKQIHEVEPNYEPTVEEAIEFYYTETDRKLMAEAVKKAIEEGTPYELDVRLHTAKGNVIWVKAKGKSVVENGKIKRVFGSFQNIDEIKKREQKLRSYELLQKLTDNIPGTVYQFEMSSDAQFKISFISKGVEKLINFLKPNEIVNSSDLTNIFSLVHPDDIGVFHESILISANNMSLWNLEYRVKVDNNVRWHRGTARPERRKDGTTVWFGYIHDITKERKMKLALEEKITELSNKNDVLEKYISKNKELERFAYVVSHDLREPLRSIKAFSEIMKKKYLSQLDEEAGTYFNFIVQSTTRMNDLIEGILNYTQIEKNEERFVNTDINNLIYVVLNDLNVMIKERGAIVEFKKLPEVYCDPLQTRQLFQNLISNSIKFTAADINPLISISHKQTKTKTTFIIKDNGIGIHPDFHEKIFGMFKQVNSRQTFEGQGIGLALCKRIVERHNGEIWVESDGANGTTFFVSFPRQ